MKTITLSGRLGKGKSAKVDDDDYKSRKLESEITKMDDDPLAKILRGK